MTDSKLICVYRIMYMSKTVPMSYGRPMNMIAGKVILVIFSINLLAIWFYLCGPTCCIIIWDSSWQCWHHWTSFFTFSNIQQCEILICMVDHGGKFTSMNRISSLWKLRGQPFQFLLGWGFFFFFNWQYFCVNNDH